MNQNGLRTIALLVITICISIFSQTKVACIGTSLAYWGYPLILQERLGCRYNVKNFYLNGSGVSDFSWISSSRFDSLVHFNPDIITIELGTNDSKGDWFADPQSRKEQFTYGYKVLVNALLNRVIPKPQIYICTSPAAFTTNGDDIKGPIIDSIIVPLTRKVAEFYQYPLIDIHRGSLYHPEYVKSDGVHPSEDGRGTYFYGNTIFKSIQLTHSVYPNMLLNCVARAPQFFSDYDPSNAVDTSLLTSWTDIQNIPDSIQFSMTNPKAFQYWAITFPNDNRVIPEDFKIRTSWDNDTWFTADSVVGNKSVYSSRRLGRPITCKYIKLVFTKCDSQDSIQQLIRIFDFRIEAPDFSTSVKLPVTKNMSLQNRTSRRCLNVDLIGHKIPLTHSQPNLNVYLRKKNNNVQKYIEHNN